MIRRGQVYFVNLNPTRGREQSRRGILPRGQGAGRRPVLVVSADPINRQPLVVTVVVGTDAQNITRDYPTNIRVGARESGLPRDTIFLCFQIRSLDPERFFNAQDGEPFLVGRLPEERMQAVDNALRLVLAL